MPGQKKKHGQNHLMLMDSGNGIVNQGRGLLAAEGVVSHTSL